MKRSVIAGFILARPSPSGSPGRSAPSLGRCWERLVPASWGLDFAFPLSFMALMFAALSDRPTVVAALAGGIIAVLAKGLPYNTGLVLATVLGIAAGYVAESMKTRQGAAQ